MKVELQCGDTITIPNGCKAVIKDGSVVFEKEEKVQDFKDGDILVSVVNGKRRNAFIYKSSDILGFHLFYAGVNADGNLSINDSSNSRWSNHNLSHATEEERQLLFDKMKEKGLKWNAEEKHVEKIRWRAEKGEIYYRMGLGKWIFREIDERSDSDDRFYDTLNYFRTEKQVVEALKRRKETLRKYHEEIGE